MGLPQSMWRLDESHMGGLILFCYFGFSMFIGWLTHQAEKHGRRVKFSYKEPEVAVESFHMKSCELMAESMLILGIIGSAISMLIMLNSAFGGAVNPTTVLNGVKAGLSTLGISTVVGLGAYLLLRVQIVNLQYAIE